ncbi:NAD-dependent epimerase/dehydratase family protein [Nonomuraea sp. NPDC051941]|uniref:NAD-dependent epimerase/dehydratase family protein n=1 Tax=Nonomuraea sp. NPDC051941 TaxID=3364373 RepID=UPI0037C7A610
MKVVVVGGTGLIGSKLVAKLGEHGHEAVAAAPSTGVNTLTGEGLAEVLAGAQVVVDVSNSPSFEPAAVMEFFEFVRAIAEEATDGDTVRIAPVRFRPIAGEEVAQAVGRVAVGQPLNGRVEVGGPDDVRMDEFFRDALAAWGDPRTVVADPQARYYGSVPGERTLVPGADAILGTIHYHDWLGK